MPLKMSPVLGAPRPVANLNEGRSASRERLDRATQIAGGQTPEAPAEPASTGDPQADRALRRIRMKTNRTIHRMTPIEQIPEAAAPSNAPNPPVLDAAPPESDILATSIPGETAPEATEPLSPQFAALARAKRALQVKEKDLLAREAALAKPPETTGMYSLDQIKAERLRILREAGVTNEMLTEDILRESQDYGPGFSELDAKVEGLKKGLEDRDKALAEREQAAEKQVLAQIDRDVQTLIAEGDEYEAVREAGYGPQVTKLIHRTFQKTGELLDVTTAAALLENELIEDGLKYARLSKIQSRLGATKAAETPAPAQAKSGQTPTKVMRTLTNRDGSSSLPMTRIQRAIAAAEGRLKN